MSGTMTKHFVTFYSPGTFFDEQTTKEIDAWDTEKAVKMARKIKERYGATPHSFQFSTEKRGPKDFEPKETKRSSLYYLGGRIETLAEIEKRNDPKEHILRDNMRCNKWDRVIVNDNSWRVHKPLMATDVVLDFTP